MANNFVLPSATQSIAIARLNWNDSLRTATTHFFSKAAPISTNYVDEGSPINPIPNGVLFISDVTGALYKNDSARKKDSPVHGGNWTRSGIAIRTEDSLAGADFATYEIGELFVTVPSNVRMYVKSSNAGGITDIGIPQSSSITTAMLQSSSVTTVKIADNNVTLDKIAHQTQGDIIFYGASGTPSILPAGSSGQFLQSQGAGANPSWQNAGLNNVQVFTSNGTWNRPPGTRLIKVTVIGGGGKGGSSASNDGAGGGGGGGAGVKFIDVTSLSSETVTVGGESGTSSFGAWVSASGGGIGGNAGGSGGAGGAGSNGNINYSGAYGSSGGTSGTGSVNIPGGTGGAAALGGGGGRGGPGNGGLNSGIAGRFPGGGGGGAHGGAPATGGSGNSGIVIIEEFK